MKTAITKPRRVRSTLLTGMSRHDTLRTDSRNQAEALCLLLFNEAYYAYGDEDSAGFSERHVFDKYIAWYRLDSPSGLGSCAVTQRRSDTRKSSDFTRLTGVMSFSERAIGCITRIWLSCLWSSGAYTAACRRVCADGGAICPAGGEDILAARNEGGRYQRQLCAANLIVPLVCVLPALPLTKPAKALYESGYAYLRYFPTSGKLTGGSSLLFLAAVLLCLAAVAAFSALGVFIAVRKR